jgi:hypothetical protein
LHRDRDSDGCLNPGGERVAGELVEYQPRIVEVFEGINYTVEQIIFAHHSRNAIRGDGWMVGDAPRQTRIAAFNTHRSLRRG